MVRSLDVATWSFQQGAVTLHALPDIQCNNNTIQIPRQSSLKIKMRAEHPPFTNPGYTTRSDLWKTTSRRHCKMKLCLGFCIVVNKD